MAKAKNRDKRKKAAIKKANQSRQQKIDDGEFTPVFSGYMQLNLKHETDDETIRKNVIRRRDWLTNSYQIFKHERKYYVEITMFKRDSEYLPAVMGVETTHKIAKEDVVTVAGAIADELSAGHTDIDFDRSYVRIYA
ncbi:hypothetical protein ACPESL_06325 [Psychrobacter pocilloporae]|uniref:hypothetical protein n=1 Tax=Psychrobacter pocilloporae TaxID=1775882 RepID=UPI003C2C93B4